MRHNKIKTRCFAHTEHPNNGRNSSPTEQPEEGRWNLLLSWLPSSKSSSKLHWGRSWSGSSSLISTSWGTRSTSVSSTVTFCGLVDVLLVPQLVEIRLELPD